MFCEPHLVMSTTAISDMSDSNTTVTTAESTIVGNDSTPLASGLENDWSNNSSADYPHTTQILKHGSGSLTGGIIILIFILILIVCLLVILYFLRKKSRSYSFDLSRPDVASNDYVDTPLSIDQQGISYEPTTKGMYLPMCLDYLNEDNTEEKTNPIANGSTGEQTEQTPTNESDFQNFPEENSFSSDSSLASPMKKVEFNLDLDLLGSDSELNNTTEAEATNTEQNENNNNVSNAGQGTAAEIFTEISLDEPKQHA
ncbi:flocculation FLO11-like isoform X1 [Labeo rohita]|uniref:Flocculation FLO11-like isoform X1 n=1 Tax=Labeo rohita TaxID=84645 RepID=A0A498NQD6_LABRO|nr:flocculation FLO11-like isoform X1 [Labeo rohita]